MPSIPHFKGLVMRNLQYELKICQISHNKITKTVHVWFDFLCIRGYQILSYHRDTVDGCDDCQVPLMIKASWLGLQFGRVVSSKIGTGALIKHFHGIVHPYRCHLCTGSLLQTSDLRSVTITLNEI